MALAIIQSDCSGGLSTPFKNLMIFHYFPHLKCTITPTGEIGPNTRVFPREAFSFCFLVGFALNLAMGFAFLISLPLTTQTFSSKFVVVSLRFPWSLFILFFFFLDFKSLEVTSFLWLNWPTPFSATGIINAYPRAAGSEGMPFDEASMRNKTFARYASNIVIENSIWDNFSHLRDDYGANLVVALGAGGRIWHLWFLFPFHAVDLIWFMNNFWI